MNKRVLRNKVKLMNGIERKHLHKHGKLWLVLGATMLAVAGGQKAAKANQINQPTSNNNSNSSNGTKTSNVLPPKQALIQNPNVTPSNSTDHTTLGQTAQTNNAVSSSNNHFSNRTIRNKKVNNDLNLNQTKKEQPKELNTHKDANIYTVENGLYQDLMVTTQELQGKPVMLFGGSYLGASFVNDPIDFTGDPSADTTMSGVKGSPRFVTPPKGFHFNDGKKQKSITLNNVAHYFYVSPDAASDNMVDDDTIQFTGDDNSSKVIHGSKGHTYYVNAPQGYHFNNNQSQNYFIFNGKTHDFPVTQDNNSSKQDTDMVEFSGDQNANTTINGTDGSTYYVSPPAGYYFTNGHEQNHFIFSNGTHIFDVASINHQNDTDTIHFNGDSTADTTMRGADGFTGYVTAPAGYHYTDGNQQETFTYNGKRHTFDVAKNKFAPTEYTDQIHFYGDPAADTYASGQAGDTYYVNAPAGYHFTKGNNQESFQFNGQIHTFNVTQNSTPVTNDTDQIVFNGDSFANTSVTGPNKQTYYVNAPAGYHFTGGKTQETFTFDNGSHAFNVSINQPKSTTDKDNIDFNGDSTADTVMYGQNGSKGLVSAPQGYHFTNKDNKGNYVKQEGFTYNGQKHTFDVAANTVTAQKVTDRIVFNGDPNADTTVTGDKNSSYQVNPPKGYYFTDGKNQESFNFKGTTHTYDVANHKSAKQDTDLIVFNGDYSANVSVKGIDGTLDYVNPPFGYKFSDGQEQDSFRFDNGVHTFDLVKIDTDTIDFTGDPQANTQVSGVAGSKYYVNAPQGYQFTDGQSQESFAFNNGTHTFDVTADSNIPNNVPHYNPQPTPVPTYDNDLIHYHGDEKADVYMHGIDGTTGVVNAPSGYHFADGNQQEFFIYNNQNHIFDVVKNGTGSHPQPNIVPVVPGKRNHPRQNSGKTNKVPNDLYPTSTMTTSISKQFNKLNPLSANNVVPNGSELPQTGSHSAKSIAAILLALSAGLLGLAADEDQKKKRRN